MSGEKLAQPDAGIGGGEVPADRFEVPVAVPASGNDLGNHWSLFREALVGARRDIRTEHVGTTMHDHCASHLSQLSKKTGHRL